MLIFIWGFVVWLLIEEEEEDLTDSWSFGGGLADRDDVLAVESLIVVSFGCLRYVSQERERRVDGFTIFFLGIYWMYGILPMRERNTFFWGLTKVIVCCRDLSQMLKKMAAMFDF
ncbi:hypothetical protein HanRHA438_Chr04g0185561 [Helianthus annuus]|uniref:Transmembrane protein n=1 Tax=Helianthus annuus TaxID=4232 RepID=A0A9K3J9S8_HELAN|nr:hypothetical protein HanXRQr2_Chr04g0176001 [Helianthus annuus]KAJ0927677.1 hypothetical protein HanRHA438_Chr04g0185561 [Helianthus annuus]